MLPSQTFILCKLPHCPKKGSGGEVIKLDGFFFVNMLVILHPKNHADFHIFSVCF